MPAGADPYLPHQCLRDKDPPQCVEAPAHMASHPVSPGDAGGSVSLGLRQAADRVYRLKEAGFVLQPEVEASYSHLEQSEEALAALQNDAMASLAGLWGDIRGQGGTLPGINGTVRSHAGRSPARAASRAGDTASSRREAPLTSPKDAAALLVRSGIMPLSSPQKTPS
eukprot:COSAG05_NODE_1635_length_4366_cov_25.922428_5_plen_167_part_01